MSAGIDFDWLREIEVTLNGGKPLLADGKTTRYKISAVINKCFNNIPSPSRIDIWNLSESTRKHLSDEETTIKIRAGWKKGPRAGLKECFIGDLMNATTHRQGANLITSINAISGIHAMSETKIAKHWPAGKSVESVMKELGEEFPNLLGVKTIGVKGSIGERGYDHCGSVKNCLEYLGKEFGASWTIVDGKFQAVGDDSRVGKDVELKEPYLISVSPAYSGVGKIQSLVEIGWQCTFEHAIGPNNMAKINSKLSPESNGTYRVNMMTHHLDCHEKRSFITTGKSSTIP